MQTDLDFDSLLERDFLETEVSDSDSKSTCKNSFIVKVDGHANVDESAAQSTVAGMLQRPLLQLLRAQVIQVLRQKRGYWYCGIFRKSRSSPHYGFSEFNPNRRSYR